MRDGRWETGEVREHLERMAEALEAPALPRGQDPKTLDAAGRKLTAWWRAKALAASRAQMRSPLYHLRKPLPQGQALYTYERSLWPVPLERNIESSWEAESVVCRNLQAAYATLLVSLRDLQAQPANVRCWHPREELGALLECLAPGHWSLALSRKTLDSSMSRADLFVLDAAHWDGEVTPAGVLALDITDRPDFPVEKVLRSSWLVATLERWDARRSGGLELSRPGELRLYAPHSTREPLTPLATAGELARRVRSVVGGCLSYAELWEWCLPELHPGPFRPDVWLPLPADLDAFRAAAARRGILEGAQRGAVGHRYRVTTRGLKVGLGMLPEELLHDLPTARPRPPRTREVAWPPEPAYREPERLWLTDLRAWRQETLRLADAAHAPRVEELEERLLTYDRCQAALLFSSAMAALTALSLLMPRLHSQARYFETRFLHEVLHAGGTDVCLAESVQYDWDLTPWTPEPARVLVLDTTLTGQRFQLKDCRYEVGIRVFSTLKLDQRGQELENAGAVLLDGDPEQVKLLRSALSNLRRSLGTEPRTARLAPPWVLSPQDDHADRVFANNAWLARHLAPGGLLRRVVYPHRSVAPFCVLHLQDDSLECHQYLCALIERLHDGPFGRGASFGFVDHRYEFIVPVLKDQRALFKVAMGSSPGPSREGVLEVLRQALGYHDLKAMRQANRGLRPVAQPADWSTPSPRMVNYLAGLTPAPVQEGG